MLIFLSLNYSVKTMNAKLKKLVDSLSKLKRFSLVAILVLEFKKIEKGDGTLYSTFYLNSKAESIINESGIDDASESIYIAIISNMQKSL